MTLVNWKPNRNMLNLFDDVERMISQGFGNDSIEYDTSVTTTPLMNIRETETEYEVHIELPGVDKKGVNVDVVEGMLDVTGERKLKNNAKESNLILREFSSGIFRRSFKLPVEIKENKIRAAFSNGILTLSIPKIEEVRPKIKKISIS